MAGCLAVDPVERLQKMKTNRSTIRPLGLLFVFAYIGLVYWLPLLRRNAGTVVVAMLLVGAAIGATSALVRHELAGKAHATFPHGEKHAVYTGSAPHEKSDLRAQ
jgi:hypothetical protein